LNAQPGGSGLGRGVYYARRDCAGFPRRLLIIAIDVLTLLLLGGAVLFVWQVVARPNTASPIPVGIWLGLAYLYLTVLRASRFRTPGYLLTGVRIVDLKGDRPSFLQMNMRLVLWAIYPLTTELDLLVFWADENRQTFRDKLAGTYVIRKRATPLGEGRIRPTTFFALGYTLVLPEVTRPARAA
jgi:uncharacterized RDD family membrane protein YckC